MQTDAFGWLKFELCEYSRLYDAELKKRANAHLKGAVHKFKSEFSEAEQSYALGELCREILDESKKRAKKPKKPRQRRAVVSAWRTSRRVFKKSLQRRRNAASALGVSDLRAQPTGAR